MKKIAIATLAVAVGTWVCLTSINVHSKPQFSAKEKKGCTTCHTPAPPKPGAADKQLSDTGKCYKENGFSLEKCE